MDRVDQTVEPRGSLSSALPPPDPAHVPLAVPAFSFEFLESEPPKFDRTVDPYARLAKPLRKD